MSRTKFVQDFPENGIFLCLYLFIFLDGFLDLKICKLAIKWLRKILTISSISGGIFYKMHFLHYPTKEKK